MCSRHYGMDDFATEVQSDELSERERYEAEQELRQREAEEISDEDLQAASDLFDVFQQSRDKVLR